MSILKTNQIQTLTGKPILNSTGSVLQVVSSSLSTTTTGTTSSTYVATGLITTVLPSTSTNSAFLIMLNGGRYIQGGATYGIALRMYVSINGGAYTQAFAGNRDETLIYCGGTDIQGQWSYNSVYSTATSLSSISFQPYIKRYLPPGSTQTGTVQFNLSNADGYGEVRLTIMEISQ